MIKIGKLFATKQLPTAGQLRVPSDLVKNLELPLPPIKEQHRIVSRLDELLPKVDTCNQRLEKIPTILKRFRQSVLVAAVTGKLTAEWRRKRASNSNSKDALTKELSRQELEYAELCRKAKDSGQRKPKKPESLKAAPLLQAFDNSLELPESWTGAPLGCLVDSKPDSVVDGPFGSSIDVKTDYVEVGIPVVRINNIRPFKFVNENLKYVKSEKFAELSRHSISPNDILLAKVGATIGDCCIYPEGLPKAMLSTTGSCRISVNKSVITSDFLCLVLCHLKSYLQQIASQTAQPFLNMDTVKKLPIPLPPLEEQDLIVRAAMKLIRTIENTEARRGAVVEYLDRLSESILSKAYSGHLVEQDPNDEPASLLLERVNFTTVEKRKKISPKKSKSDKAEQLSA